jgi:hypothetical protein
LGSCKNQFALLSVDESVRQGAKVPEYRDISSIRNVAGSDASAIKNVKLILREPLMSANATI